MIPPRILRKRDAPAYCGLCPQAFDLHIRPYLTEIPIPGVRPGTPTKGVGFDRLEIDAWLEEFIRRNGRKAQKEQTWEHKQPPDYASVAQSGTLKKSGAESEFTRALAQATSKKRNATSPTA